MSTATQTINEQALELRALKQRYAEVKSIADDAKLEADRAEMAFFERLQSEKVQSIKVDGTNFVAAETVYGAVQDRSAFIVWAEVNNPELLEVKERKALINELVREYVDNGEVLPPGLGSTVKSYVSQRVG